MPALDGRRLRSLRTTALAIALWLTACGEASQPRQAAFLEGRAIVLLRAGDHAAARPLLERAVALREHAPEDAALAFTLHMLATTYTVAEPRPRDAISLLDRALRINLAAYGESHESVAATLGNLGWLNATLGDYEIAEQQYDRAIRVAAQLELPGDARATLFANRARLYQTVGRAAEAEAEYRSSLQLFEGSETESLLARGAAALASLVFGGGPGSEGDRVVKAAATRAQLASLYVEQGNLDEAQGLLDRALAEVRGVRGERHADVGGLLNSLGAVYFFRGDLERARSHVEESLEIAQHTLSKDSPLLAPVLHHLATIYQGLGLLEQAARTAQQSLDTLKRAHGTEHPDIAIAELGYAEAELQLGHAGVAAEHFAHSLALSERFFGADHLRVPMALQGLARTRWEQGSLASALETLQRQTDIEERLLQRTLGPIPEARRTELVKQLQTSTDLIISFQLATGSAEAARLALTTLLRRNGRSLSATSAQLDALRERVDVQSRGELAAIATLRARVAGLALAKPGALDPSAHRELLAELTAQLDERERVLAARRPELLGDRRSVDLAAARRALPRDGALLAYARFIPQGPRATWMDKKSAPQRYVGYLLRPDGTLRSRDLGPASEIDEAVGALRRALNDPGDPRFAERAERLDALVLEPLVSGAMGVRHLIVSPDDALHLVPFAALRHAGRYRIASFLFTYVSNELGLLVPPASTSPRSPPLVLGASSFGARRSEPASDTSGCVPSAFGPLPEAEAEARAVAAMLGVEAIVGEQASEARLRSAHTPLILHVATHGFFPEIGARDVPIRCRDPLLRSGLALADVGTGAEASSSDGVLTALEAAALDLSGTELAVLSACGSGVGPATSGEGVYGLRRALTLAGARTQVMSLWRAPDLPTRKLMERFYRELLAGAGRSEALRRAQLAQLGEQATSRPYDWASFIASGDWRPLPGLEQPRAVDRSQHPSSGRSPSSEMQ